MKSMTLSNCHVDVCCDCHEWKGWHYRIVTWTYVVIVTNEIDDTIELPHGRMLWLSRMKSMTLSNCQMDVCCDCHEWNRWHYRIVTWTYVVIVTNEIDDTIELSHGRMLWLSLMKSMTLSNCHMDVCCDCHEWNRWHYRIATWTYVVIVTNEIDDTIELPHGRMLWLSLMKSMTLSNCHMDVCCDCH